MKTLTAFRRKVLFLMILFGCLGFGLKQNMLVAQVPDCTGTVMYALWNDSTGSTTNNPSEIRSINYTTGAVGPRVGGVTYLIQKAGAGGPYYGSAGMALDPVNKHFFVNTQMSSGNGLAKDFIDINPVSGAMTIIGTTPPGVTPTVPDIMSNYHFVKLAVSPGGIGYAIGVHRDTSIGGFSAAKCNPLISFTTCGGAPTANCSVITLLGYLSNSTNITTNYRLFNGDIAFDNAGNLYFLTVGFARVAGNGRYTDARLFKISAANIPLVAGTGQIPLSLIADYNGLDSTVVNGIAFNMLGQMFFSTRKFNGPQNNPLPTFNNLIYKSTTPGAVTLLAGFTNPIAGYSVADLASCNFPAGVLSDVKLQLSGWNESGTGRMKWEVNMNNQVSHYELQSGNNGNDFETIASINPLNINSASATYTYADVQKTSSGAKYYRVREVMPDGSRFYSNVIKINYGAKLQLISKPSPNPVINQFDLRVELKTSSVVNIRLRNQGGAIVYQRNVTGGSGDNKFTVDGLARLTSGIYIVEITVDEEIIREKLIKQ